MVDPIEELKTRARVLHKRARVGDEPALKRLGKLPEGEAIQRKHCLSAVAGECGFSGWQHATRVLSGDPGELDFGTGLYPRRTGGFTNRWFAQYEAARASLRESGGFLLAYRRQFFVVTATFIDALGLDPQDPDWAAIGHDWARPRDREARARLYGRLIAAR